MRSIQDAALVSAMDSTNAASLVDLAQYLILAGRFREGLTAATSAIKRFPTFADAYRVRSRIYHVLGPSFQQSASADELKARALDKDPTSLRWHPEPQRMTTAVPPLVARFEVGKKSSKE